MNSWRVRRVLNLLRYIYRCSTSTGFWRCCSFERAQCTLVYRTQPDMVLVVPFNSTTTFFRTRSRKMQNIMFTTAGTSTWFYYYKTIFITEISYSRYRRRVSNINARAEEIVEGIRNPQHPLPHTRWARSCGYPVRNVNRTWFKLHRKATTIIYYIVVIHQAPQQSVKSSSFCPFRTLPLMSCPQAPLIRKIGSRGIHENIIIRVQKFAAVVWRGEVV